jgi:hypothetical protein
MSMTITSTRGTKRGGLRALAGLAAALLGGCATTGDGPGSGAAAGSATGGSAAERAERDFYADWYDSTAVVLPPPADATARR